MRVFSFIDNVLEVEKNQSITAFYTLKGSEEFLLDHFEGFPVMPGVLLLESAKQAASKLLELSEGMGSRYQLSEVPMVKFGQFVKPGSRLKIQVVKTGCNAGRANFDGKIHLMLGEQEGPRALQALFSLEKIV